MSDGTHDVLMSGQIQVSPLTGTASPEGSVTGQFYNQVYLQLDGAGADVATWHFRGTTGANTGWV